MGSGKKNVYKQESATKIETDCVLSLRNEQYVHKKIFGASFAKPKIKKKEVGHQGFEGRNIIRRVFFVCFLVSNFTAFEQTGKKRE